MTQFIAVDGEADNNGNYILLCDSTGRVLYDPNGISSTDAFEFITTLPRKCEIVCYGLNYDVNQWIKDLPRSTLERLATENRCAWRGDYKLQWIPSKTFSVKYGNKSTTVCEVFGFFQTSFVKALQQWDIPQSAEIETMKRKRGRFTRKELQRVTEYCLEECRLLVKLMEKLQAACVTAGCVPQRRWIGAGSIASSLMNAHGVRAHHAYDADLFGRELTDEYVLRAYFGGRVELYQQGWVSDVAAHDVRSAYPAAALHLPSLQDAFVSRTTKYDPYFEYALWYVSWYMCDEQVGPFPVRLPHGDICYPCQGEGVYHAGEVRMAIRCGYNVRVHDGVIITPSSKESFEWIRDIYKVRAQFKREGNFAEKALKLGLNSVYGKMAQGYGFGRRPPFQSYFWAGYITSYTRARVLEKLAHRPVMVATDGIVLPSTAPQFPSDELGGWEIDSYERLATIQPGVYVAERNGERIVKSRGFFARDVDYDELVSNFEHDSLGCYHYKSQRFIGLKVALHRKDFSVWRTWPDERRSIAFEVKNKRRVQVGNNVILYPIEGPYSSLPYVPKQSLYDDPSDVQLENLVRDDQPHREVD